MVDHAAEHPAQLAVGPLTPAVTHEAERAHEGETRHRLLIESWAQAVWEADADGVVVADSPSWRAHTGQTLEEWLGYGWLNAIHPDDRAYAEQQWREAVAARVPVDAEFRLCAPDGGWRWTNVRAAPVLDARGNIEKWVGMNIDIDARKRAETALRESETRLRIATEANGIGTWELFLHEDGTTAALTSSRHDAVFGYDEPVPEWNAEVFLSHVLPGHRDDVARRLREAVEAGGAWTFEAPICPKGGTGTRWIEAHGQPVEHDRAGRAVRFVGIVRDVTDIHVTTQALQEREELFRAFAENSVDTIWIADARGERLEYLSPAFERMFGEPRDVVMADIRRWGEFVHPADREAAGAFMPRAVAGETAIGHYRVIRAADGRVVHLRDMGFPIRDSAGSVIRVAGIVQDISDIEAARSALEAEKERFRIVVEGIPQMTWRSLDRGRWTWASPQWQAFTGQSPQESRGLGWLDALHPDDRGRALAAWAGAGPHGRLDMEYRIQRASDGTWRWHQTRSLPVRSTPGPGRPEGHIIEWLGTSTDIENLKRYQAEQAVLLAELQHRTRNLVAVTRNIAKRSFGPSPERDTYDDRLAAIGRVQGFLARGGNWSVPLHDLVQAELVAAGDGHSDRIVVEGPAVELPGDKAQIMALALHELATNAAKYGAISQDRARLRVTWQVEGGETAEDRLVLQWRESGVIMPATPPARRGYGSELIERALPYQLKAHTHREFTPDGVHCTIALPVDAFRVRTSGP